MDATSMNVAVLKAAGITVGGITVPVTTKVPADRPDLMICVSREGGYMDEFFDHPTMTLLCWGRTDAEASGLALSAAHALSDAALDHPLLSSSEMESMSRDEWTPNGAARYRVMIQQTINR